MTPTTALPVPAPSLDNKTQFALIGVSFNPATGAWDTLLIKPCKSKAEMVLACSDANQRVIEGHVDARSTRSKPVRIIGASIENPFYPNGKEFATAKLATNAVGGHPISFATKARSHAERGLRTWEWRGYIFEYI
jgi:hypothetical protein